jgi:hypothetical protein
MNEKPFGQFGGPGYLGRGYDHSRVAGPTANTRPYGDAAADEAAKKAQQQELAVGLISKYLEEDDPAVIAAKIQNYQRMLQTFPGNIPPLKTFYTNEINKLQAKLATASAATSITETWRSLGQTGAALGIIAGVGLVALISAVTYRTIKATPKRNPRRRRNGKRALARRSR